MEIPLVEETLKAGAPRAGCRIPRFERWLV